MIFIDFFIAYLLLQKLFEYLAALKIVFFDFDRIYQSGYD